MAIRNSSVDTNEYDEEIDETEDDLIENYLYLTRRCGALRHSQTSSALDNIEKEPRRTKPSAIFSRQYSLAVEPTISRFSNVLHSPKASSSVNDFNNNYSDDLSSTMNHIPATIYYNVDEDQFNENYSSQPFSLVKLFARMKARLKHDRRYRPDSTHQLLHEEESQEWLELTKNTRKILTKALLPDGGYDALARNYRPRRKTRESDLVLVDDLEDDNEKIHFDIDDMFGAEDDPEYDEIIWEKFLKCMRGYSYRRCAVCKAIDRQYFQGQLVYVYGVANNIIIDENLKASGLG